MTNLRVFHSTTTINSGQTRSFTFLVMMCLGALVLLLPNIVNATDAKKDPVDLQADKLIHDNNGKSVTASGDVILKQAGRMVEADKIIYHLNDDTVVATGNVIFTETNGDKHYADNVKFNDALKNGFVEALQTILVDGSRFKASSGKYEGGTKTIMKDAFYTPCAPCVDDPEKSPTWQIRASEVEHDKDEKRISYRNVRFEVRGVPVLYSPYFSHPDGSVKRKSGFLTPSAGFSSDLGGFLENKYYWSVAPDKDMTVAMRIMTQEAPLTLLQWRQRWENASLIVNGGLTYSQRTSNEDGIRIVHDEAVRGHFAVDGLWNINNKWRSGINLYYASDDQYLRQYDFTSADVLKNEAYIERFSGRNYAVGRLLAFQDLRIAENREDQPNVMPEIQASFIGEPGSMPLIGGRWSFDASSLSLIRDNNQQDVNRINVDLGWKRRLVSNYGLLTTIDTSIQGALYNINDRTGAKTSPFIDEDSSEARAFGYINAMTSYPMSKTFKESNFVIEPMVSITVAPNIGIESDIPNEDSQDVQLDALNIFEADRFPGIDGVEDRSHATYGLRAGLYDFNGSYGDVFLGQSYRFDKDDNPFREGSGLNDQSSDVVGQVSASYKGDYTLDYRFQLDNTKLSPQRHEVDAAIKFGNIALSSQYLFAKALDGTEINETREQITNSASYNINDNWRIYGAARHDLGNSPGLRQANFGIDYLGQCTSLSLIAARTLTTDASGDSGTEIFLRIGFKNLGEFQTSSFQLGGVNN